MSYKGWTNYETSVVNDWIEEDAEVYSDVRRLCKIGLSAEAADRLERLMRELMPEVEETVWQAFMRRGMQHVDWYALATTFKEDS